MSPTTGKNKICSKCKEEKSLSEFTKEKSNKTDGLRGDCKSCLSKRQKQYYRSERCQNWYKEYHLRTKEKRQQYGKEYWLKNPDRNIKYQYGLSKEDWNVLFEDQGSKCNICEIKEARFVIDHCHETGKIRGILCHKCNAGIGLLQDNVNILEKAILHLKGNNRGGTN